MTKLVRFDWAMKYLLRHKANFGILEGFLSELLKTDIKIENVLESEGNKNTEDDKFNRVDLLVQTGQKERIIIEVQCSTQWDYLSRVLYGTSKTVTEHIREGSPYKDVCKVISVSIVFFNLGEGKDYLYKGQTVFRGMHYDDVLKLGEKELDVYGQGKMPADVFPEYYIIKVNQFRETIKNKFDEWVYFLRNAKIEPSFQAQGIQLAAKKFDVLQFDEQERRAYDLYQEGKMYESSMLMSYHIQGRHEGLEEGRAKGLQEGLAKGLEEGLAKGLEEGLAQSRLEIAKKMLAKGISLEEVNSIVGLPVDILNIALCGE